MHSTTPLGALGRGLAAGAVGAGVQNAFFLQTAAISPQPPADAFHPPELEQLSESALETVARRFSSGLLAREPLEKDEKKAAGNLIHFGYGALWGGLYGLIRETFPSLARPGPGIIGYGTAVWTLSDNVILPAFHLAAWPHRYPLRSHAYAWVAHMAYAGGLWAVYEVLRPRLWLALGAGLWSARTQLRVSRQLPRRARRIARSAVRAIAPLVAWRPSFREAARALQ